MDNPVVVPLVAECPDCGGSGYRVAHGCCGNVGDSGECKAWCVVPVQVGCHSCGGGGAIEVEPPTEPTPSQPASPPHESGLDDDDREIGEPVEIVNLRPWSPHESAGENDLAIRCDEILSWKKTGIYEGSALQTLADELERQDRDTHISPILSAEKVTIDQALEFTASSLATPDLQAENARLRGALEWQPIETAPIDGTWFIAFWPVAAVEDQVRVTQWMNDPWEPCFIDSNQWIDLTQPTHWMPLPEPPARLALSTKGEG